MTNHVAQVSLQRKSTGDFGKNESNSATPLSHVLEQDSFKEFHKKRWGHNGETINCDGKLVTASLYSSASGYSGAFQIQLFAFDRYLIRL